MKPGARIRALLPLLVFGCIGIGWVHAQSPDPGATRTIKLPGGEAVFDISGEWNIAVQNYGDWERYGSYPQVFKITQVGSSFSGIRLKDNPPPSNIRAGSKSVQGEVDKSGITRLDVIGGGEVIPGKWQLFEGGNRMTVDATQHARQTWTRK